MSAEQENTKSTIKNIIAIIGFIILLAIGVWSAIQVIKFVPRLFSETGTITPTNTIDLGNRDIALEVSTLSANSGEPITLTWAHTGDETGILSFSYACTEGFYFQIAGRPAPCNAPYNIPATNLTLEVTPLSAKQNVEVPLALTYTNADGESVRDTKTLTVMNAAVVVDEETPSSTEQDTTKEGTISKGGPVEPVSNTTQTKTQTPQPVVKTIKVPRVSNPYGIADISVEMIAIGDINQYGAFEPKGVLRTYTRGAAKFRVTNLGDKETGLWYFNATLPTQGGYPFNSQAQSSLMPGSSVDIFMTFDQLVPGVHTFHVQVDPYNAIPELNEYNNATGQNITVLNY